MWETLGEKMEGLQHVQTESLRIHADGSDTYLNL